MTVETATLISDLNASYPSATDPKSEGDNHIRLIKSALKATFPNFTDVVLANQTQINHSIGVTSPIQTQLDGKLSKSGGAVIGDVSITGATTLNGDVTHTGNYSQTGTHSVAGQITAVNSTVRAYNVASSAQVLLSEVGLTADFVAASGTITRDLILRGAYSASAPIPEGTVTIPSRLVAQSDIYASKTILAVGSGAIGYGAGAGGTVTQATSKSTAVTLNKPSGAITMNAEALAAGATNSFAFNNSFIAGGDLLFLGLATSASVTESAYSAWAATQNGLAVVFVKNISGSSLSEPVVLTYSLFKASTS